MLKLGVKKFSEDSQLIDPSKVYGTVQEIMDEFANDNDLKEVELRPASALNVANVGSQFMFIIREKNGKKKKENLLTSDRLYLSRTMSDALRTGELHASAIKDFILVEHENNTDGSIYPLIVRPQEVADDNVLDPFAITNTMDVTVKYERPDANVDDVMKSFNL